MAYPARAEPPKKVFGLERVIAFTYIGGKYDPKQLRSVTFIEPTQPKDWQYWAPRGVASAVGHTWFDLLRNPADKAVDILAGGDYGGNPKPVVSIDEFGFDYGGETDEKAAAILRETKHKRPELGLAVWEMRGPIPKVLGDAYRDVVDLVTLESYLKDKDDYWFAAAQVQSARIHGILPKTIVALGIGKGGNPGEEWACTKEELEQQVRFVRMIAPEAPGIGFYSGSDWPELLAKADELSQPLFRSPHGRLETARRRCRVGQVLFRAPRKAAVGVFAGAGGAEPQRGRPRQIGGAENHAGLRAEPGRPRRDERPYPAAQPQGQRGKRFRRGRGPRRPQARGSDRSSARYGRMEGLEDLGNGGRRQGLRGEDIPVETLVRRTDLQFLFPLGIILRGRGVFRKALQNTFWSRTRSRAWG